MTVLLQYTPNPVLGYFRTQDLERWALLLGL